MKTMALTLIGLSALAGCTLGSKSADKAKVKPTPALESQKSLAEGALPNPSDVTVRGITYAGSGCPANSVASNISPDAKALTLVFDGFNATVDPFATSVGDGTGVNEARRNCQVTLDLIAPTGYTYSLFTVDTRGFAQLDAGVTGRIKSFFYFQAQAQGADFEHVLTGEYNDNYQVRADVDVETNVEQPYLWSPCEGASRALNLNTEIVVDNGSDPTARGYMTVDSIDGEFKHVYGIKWAKCQTQPTLPTDPIPPPVDTGSSLSFYTTIAELAARHPHCSGPWSKTNDMSCRAAARRMCAERGYAGGMLVEYDSVNSAQVVCMKGELKTPALSDLTALHPHCTGRYGPQLLLACDTAATNLCGGNFAGSFLQEYNGETNSAAVICVAKQGADMHSPSIGALSTFHPNCAGGWNEAYSSISCNAAYSRYCRATNPAYKSGFIVAHNILADASVGVCLK